MLLTTFMSLLEDPEFQKTVDHRVKIFKQDQKILLQDQEHQHIYLIQKGLVRVVMKKDISAHTLRPGIANLGQNEIFGELSLFDELPASADVVAVEDSTLLEIDIKSFKKYLDNNHKVGHEIYHGILLSLVKRLRQSDKTILHLYEWGIRAHKLDSHLGEKEVETERPSIKLK